MDEWGAIPIEAIAEIHNHRRVPLSKMEREKKQGDYPYYGASGIIDFVDDFLFDGEFVLVSEDGENLKTRKTPIAFEAKGQFWVNNHAHILKGKEPFHNDLLVYAFANLDLTPYITGAVQPKLNKANLLSIELELPLDHREQEAIAEVLSSLDDKIDLLKRQNKTLEGMAEALFRQWFIEEAQDDWEEVPLGEFIEIHDKKRIPKSSMERAEMKDGILFPYYGAAQIMDFVNDFIFDFDSVLVGEDGSVIDDDGFAIIQTAFDKYWVNNHAHVLTPIRGFNLFGLWCYFKTNPIRHAVTGAVQPKLNQKNLKALLLRLPNEGALSKYAEATNCLWDKRKINCSLVQQLERTRDILLPKLMSGEVRVKMAS